MIFIRILVEYLKVGFFAVGGGMVTLPFLSDIGRTNGWFSDDQLIDMLAISETTPGPIGINMATFSGYSAGGFIGALIGTLAVALPGVMFVLIFYRIGYKQSNTLGALKRFFYGVRPVAAGLICSAGLVIAKLAFFKNGHLAVCDIRWETLILALIIFIFSRYVPQTRKLHPVIFIGFAVLVAVLYRLVQS